jgi:hypothetical protein
MRYASVFKEQNEIISLCGINHHGRFITAIVVASAV